MSAVQRRRGLPCRIEKVKLTTDLRGNPIWESDPNDYWEGRASFVPERGNKSDAPGQLTIKVATITVGDKAAAEANIWSRVYINGHEWDLATPWDYHRGMTRNIRHWSAEIRRRPVNVHE